MFVSILIKSIIAKIEYRLHTPSSAPKKKYDIVESTKQTQTNLSGKLKKGNAQTKYITYTIKFACSKIKENKQTINK